MRFVWLFRVSGCFGGFCGISVGSGLGLVSLLGFGCVGLVWLLLGGQTVGKDMLL